MTKKHLIDLAARLRRMRPRVVEVGSAYAKQIADAKHVQWWQMVEEMANFCAAHGENFDRERFLTAVSD